MMNVPIQPVNNQTLTIQLANQNCQLNIYQKFYGLFIDVYVNNTLIVGGAICENLNRIIHDAYLGFVGDFTFVDTQGSDDPVASGLGSRFLLVYLEATDISS